MCKSSTCITCISTVRLLRVSRLKRSASQSCLVCLLSVSSSCLSDPFFQRPTIWHNLRKHIIYSWSVPSCQRASDPGGQGEGSEGPMLVPQMCVWSSFSNETCHCPTTKCPFAKLSVTACIFLQKVGKLAQCWQQLKCAARLLYDTAKACRFT